MVGFSLTRLPPTRLTAVTEHPSFRQSFFVIPICSRQQLLYSPVPAMPAPTRPKKYNKKRVTHRFPVSVSNFFECDN